MLKRFFSLMTAAVLFSGVASAQNASAPASSQAVKAKKKAPLATSCVVSVDAKDTQGEISPLLMGFNLVYAIEPDAFWSGGKIENLLKDLKCKLLRWPGGEVTSAYHWNNLISAREMDTWNPKYKEQLVDQSKIMDLEEYMTHVRAIGCEPMVGVNMVSGFKYNRMQDGLNEAKALIQHCVDNKYNVKYWFLDNECYDPAPEDRQGSRIPEMTPEQYGECINQYTAVLKSVDPNIKIIANWSTGWNASWQKLLRVAGKNIDIADFHMYWRFGGSSWELWLDELMGPSKTMARKDYQIIGENSSYESVIRSFKKETKAQGYDIEVASMEWNVGPNPKLPLSEFQVGLMEAEEFGQFINAGMSMACLWPLHWPGDKNAASGASSYRTMLDHETGEPRANYAMFKMYSDAMGQTLLGSKADAPEVYTVAAKSIDGKSVILYLLRRTDEAPALKTTINLKNFAPASAKAKCYNAKSVDLNKADVTELPIQSLSPLTIDLPAHSFTQITLSQ